MRGILIDPYERAVREVETKGALDDMYGLLGVQCVCHVSLTRGEFLWLDDNGFLKENIPVFYLGPKSKQPLAGRGLILGASDDGNNCSTKIPLALVSMAVRWSDEVSSGELGPTTEGASAEYGFVIRTGDPILKAKSCP